ncbi:hypothetical protein [Acinetobacter sp. WY4]|uniref:hypothetical protein n=1 Tax=Acinetobacter sp. WY4 TaxID=2708348 RepID=UPI001BD0B1D7|nr:hypothetical protein [Acinetobacter sp. WY4]
MEKRLVTADVCVGGRMNSFFLEKLAIVAGHASLNVIDNFTLNAGSTIKNAISDVVDYTRKCNDALLYLRIKTFIESTTLDEEEVNTFLAENSDNFLLGLEVLKTLEQTITNQQAEMTARNFTLMVRRRISLEMYYKVQHIILRLNGYLLTELRKDAPNFEDSLMRYGLDYQYYDPAFMFNHDPSEDEKLIYRFENNIRKYLSEDIKSSSIQDYLAFDFVTQITTEAMAGATHIPLPKYRKTPFLLWFYFNIFETRF